MTDELSQRFKIALEKSAVARQIRDGINGVGDGLIKHAEQTFNNTAKTIEQSITKAGQINTANYTPNYSGKNSGRGI